MNKKDHSTLIFSILITLAAAGSHAASITVATIDDISATACTLRDAIVAANTDTASGACNSGSGDDSIVFSPGLTGAIAIASTLPAIDSNLTITGPATSPGITVDGGNAVQLMVVTSSASAEIYNLTLTKGASPEFVAGGAIKNSGSLKLVGSVLTNNVSSLLAGAIDNLGTLTITNSTLSSNRGANDAGAILNGPLSTLSITNSSFLENSTFVTGGAILNNGVLTVIGSSFINNRASVAGAISNRNVLIVTASTFAGNIGGSSGGALNNFGMMTVNNSTFTANQASDGSAIYNYIIGTTNITHSTLVDNFSDNAGPAIVNLGSATLLNSVLSENLVGNCSNVVDLGGNISDDSSCNFTDATSLVVLDANLAPLAANGGPTLTIALLADSPAIGAADCSPVSPTDQRGAPRPGVDVDAISGFKTMCDSGAYETGDGLLAFVGANPLDFGAVTAPTSATATVQNVGNEIVKDQTLSIQPIGSPFTIDVAPNTSAIPVQSFRDYVLTFAPTADGIFDASFEVQPSAMSAPLISLALQGEGSGFTPPPAPGIAELILYVATHSTQDPVDLFGAGNGKKAVKNLQHFVKKLQVISNSIDKGRIDNTCDQLEELLQKADGMRRPPDWIVGAAVGADNGVTVQLNALLDSFSCEVEHDHDDDDDNNHKHHRGDRDYHVSH